MLNPKLTKGVTAVSVAALLAGGVLAANVYPSQAEGNGQVRAAFAGLRDKFFARADAEGRGHMMAWYGGKTELSAEQKAELEVQRTARQEAAAKKRAEIKAALEAGDYNRWVAAVGADSAIANKVTAENFARFVQAYRLRVQSDDILRDLGFDARAKAGMHHGWAW